MIHRITIETEGMTDEQAATFHNALDLMTRATGKYKDVISSLTGQQLDDNWSRLTAIPHADGDWIQPPAVKVL